MDSMCNLARLCWTCMFKNIFDFLFLNQMGITIAYIACNLLPNINNYYIKNKIKNKKT